MGLRCDLPMSPSFPSGGQRLEPGIEVVDRDYRSAPAFSRGETSGADFFEQNRAADSGHLRGLLDRHRTLDLLFQIRPPWFDTMVLDEDETNAGISQEALLI